MEENKSYITDVLANQMMDNYACVYLSINNCVSQDEEGNIICSQEDAEQATTFARECFNTYMDSMKERFNREIEVLTTTTIQPEEEVVEETETE